MKLRLVGMGELYEAEGQSKIKMEDLQAASQALMEAILRIFGTISIKRTERAKKGTGIKVLRKQIAEGIQQGIAHLTGQEPPSKPNRAEVRSEDIRHFRLRLTDREEKILAQIVRNQPSIIAAPEILERIPESRGGGPLKDEEVQQFFAITPEGLQAAQLKLFQEIPQEKQERYQKAWEGLAAKKDFASYLKSYDERRQRALESAWQKVAALSVSLNDLRKMSLEEFARLNGVIQVPGLGGKPDTPTLAYISAESYLQIEEIRKKAFTVGGAEFPAPESIPWWLLPKEIRGPGIYMFPDQIAFEKNRGQFFGNKDHVFHELVEQALDQMNLQDETLNFYGMIFHKDLSVLEAQLQFAALMGEEEFKEAIQGREIEIKRLHNYPSYVVQNERFPWFIERMERLLRAADYTTYRKTAEAIWERLTSARAEVRVVKESLFSGQKGNRLSGIREEDVETREEILPSEKIKTNSQIWRKANRGFEADLTDLDRQAMKVHRNRISVPDGGENFGTPGEVESNAVRLERRKDRDRGSRIDVRFRFKPLPRSVKGKLDDGTGMLAVNLVGKENRFFHALRRLAESTEIKSRRWGTGKPTGGPYSLLSLFSSLGSSLDDLTGKIWPDTTNTYGKRPPYRSTIISKLSLIQPSLSNPVLFLTMHYTYTIPRGFRQTVPSRAEVRAGKSELLFGKDFHPRLEYSIEEATREKMEREKKKFPVSKGGPLKGDLLRFLREQAGKYQKDLEATGADISRAELGDQGLSEKALDAISKDLQEAYDALQVPYRREKINVRKILISFFGTGSFLSRTELEANVALLVEKGEVGKLTEFFRKRKKLGRERLGKTDSIQTFETHPEKMNESGFDETFGKALGSLRKAYRGDSEISPKEVEGWMNEARKKFEELKDSVFREQKNDFVERGHYGLLVELLRNRKGMRRKELGDEGVVGRIERRPQKVSSETYEQMRPQISERLASRYPGDRALSPHQLESDLRTAYENFLAQHQGGLVSPFRTRLISPQVLSRHREILEALTQEVRRRVHAPDAAFNKSAVTLIILAKAKEILGGVSFEVFKKRVIPQVEQRTAGDSREFVLTLMEILSKTVSLNDLPARHRYLEGVFPRSEVRKTGFEPQATGSKPKPEGPSLQPAARSLRLAQRAEVRTDAGDRGQKAEDRRRNRQVPLTSVVSRLSSEFPHRAEVRSNKEEEQIEKAGLLHSDYIELDRAVGQIVNPNNNPFVSLYLGAGVDLSNLSLSTRFTRAYFMGRYFGLSAVDLNKFFEQSPETLGLYGTASANPFYDQKYFMGSAPAAALQLKKQILGALAFELIAIGVDLKSVKIDEEEGHPRLQFNKGRRENKEYAVTFLDVPEIREPGQYPENTRRLLGKLAGQIDAVYLRAGSDIPQSYEAPENPIDFLKPFLKEGGYFITDDYAYDEPGDFHRDLSGHFPTEGLQEIAIPGFSDFESKILKLRETRMTGRALTPDSPRMHYGWHVRIRQKKTQPPQPPFSRRSEVRVEKKEEGGEIQSHEGLVHFLASQLKEIESDPLLMEPFLESYLATAKNDPQKATALQKRTHRLILRAFQSVSRKDFVLPRDREKAFQNRILDIGSGQTLSEPGVVLEMLALAGPDLKGKILDVGSGSGYTTALLSHLGEEVYAIDQISQFVRKSSRLLRGQLGLTNTHFRLGDGTKGWPRHAPYHLIFVSAQGHFVPPALEAELEEGGVLILPLITLQEHSQMVRFVKRDGKIEREVTAPDLYGFVPFKGAVDPAREPAHMLLELWRLLGQQADRRLLERSKEYGLTENFWNKLAQVENSQEQLDRVSDAIRRFQTEKNNLRAEVRRAGLRLQAPSYRLEEQGLQPAAGSLQLGRRAEVRADQTGKRTIEEIESDLKTVEQFLGEINDELDRINKRTQIMLRVEIPFSIGGLILLGAVFYDMLRNGIFVLSFWMPIASVWAAGAYALKSTKKRLDKSYAAAKVRLIRLERERTQLNKELEGARSSRAEVRMLVHATEPGKSIRIGNDIRVTPIHVTFQNVLFSIELPADVRIHTQEGDKKMEARVKQGIDVWHFLRPLGGSVQIGSENEIKVEVVDTLRPIPGKESRAVHFGITAPRDVKIVLSELPPLPTKEVRTDYPLGELKVVLKAEMEKIVKEQIKQGKKPVTLSVEYPVWRSTTPSAKQIVITGVSQFLLKHGEVEKSIKPILDELSYLIEMKHYGPLVRIERKAGGIPTLSLSFVSRAEVRAERKERGERKEGKGEKNATILFRRSQSVAEKRGTGEVRLSIDAAISQRGTVWTHRTNEKGRGFNSREYRGRKRERTQERRVAVPPRGSGFRLRTDRAPQNIPGARLFDPVSGRGTFKSLERDRRHAQRINPDTSVVSSLSPFPSSLERSSSLSEEELRARVDAELARQGRNLPDVSFVAFVVTFGYIAPVDLAAIPGFLPLALLIFFGVGLAGSVLMKPNPARERRYRNQLREIRPKTRPAASSQTTRTVVLIPFNHQLPEVDLEAMELPVGSRVIILTKDLKSFDAYSKVRLPGVQIRRAVQENKLLVQLQKILSRQPDSIPIVIGPPEFEEEEMEGYRSAAREGFIVRMPRLKIAQTALSDWLGHSSGPEELDGKRFKKFLTIRVYSDTLSPVSVSMTSEKSFADFYLSALAQERSLEVAA